MEYEIRLTDLKKIEVAEERVVTVKHILAYLIMKGNSIIK